MSAWFWSTSLTAAVASEGPGSSVGRDIAEIAELLADPIGIVVEHLDRAARRNPADRVGGGARVDAAQRGGR